MIISWNFKSRIPRGAATIYREKDTYSTKLGWRKQVQVVHSSRINYKLFKVMTTNAQWITCTLEISKENSDREEVCSTNRKLKRRGL